MAEEKRNSSVATILDYQIMKELPLLKVEHWLLGAVTFLAIMFFMAQLLGLIDWGLFVILALPLATAWLLWALKKFLYLPRGKHGVWFLVIYKTGAMTLMPGQLTDEMKIKISKTENALETHIVDVRAHTEAHTGIPVVVIFEDAHENVDLWQLKTGQNIDRQKHEDAVVKSSWAAGVLYGMAIMKRLLGMTKSPFFWMLVVILLVVGLNALISFGILSSLNQLTEFLTKTAGGA